MNKDKMNEYQPVREVLIPHVETPEVQNYNKTKKMTP